jgi:hypothetical protein
VQGEHALIANADLHALGEEQQDADSDRPQRPPSGPPQQHRDRDLDHAEQLDAHRDPAVHLQHPGVPVKELPGEHRLGEHRQRVRRHDGARQRQRPRPGRDLDVPGCGLVHGGDATGRAAPGRRPAVAGRCDPGGSWMVARYATRCTAACHGGRH